MFMHRHPHKEMKYKKNIKKDETVQLDILIHYQPVRRSVQSNAADGALKRLPPNEQPIFSGTWEQWSFKGWSQIEGVFPSLNLSNYWFSSPPHPPLPVWAFPCGTSS